MTKLLYSDRNGFCFKEVTRENKNRDMFLYAKHLCPVFYGSHFTLIAGYLPEGLPLGSLTAPVNIADFGKVQIHMFEGLNSGPNIGDTGMEQCKAFAQFLCLQACAKGYDLLLDNIEIINARGPQQNDFFNCAVNVLIQMILIANDLPFAYSSKQFSAARDKFLRSMLTGELLLEQPLAALDENGMVVDPVGGTAGETSLLPADRPVETEDARDESQVLREKARFDHLYGEADVGQFTYVKKKITPISSTSSSALSSSSSSGSSSSSARSCSASGWANNIPSSSSETAADHTKSTGWSFF